MDLDTYWEALVTLGGTAATIITLSVCLEVVALLLPIGSQVIVDEVVTAYDYDLLLVVAAGIALLVLIQLVVGCCARLDDRSSANLDQLTLERQPVRSNDAAAT